MLSLRADRIEVLTMKLTPKEQEICDKYGALDADGYVHCNECPLNICDSYIQGFECYATIDGRTKEAKGLIRYK